jgi:hypothetical protein
MFLKALSQLRFCSYEDILPVSLTKPIDEFISNVSSCVLGHPPCWDANIIFAS